MKFTAAVVAASVASASAFAPQPAFRVSNTALNMEKGAGGMFDTRNPDAMEHEDPRKSISAAPSFEEYLKQRDGGGAAAAAPAAEAPAAAAPAAAASSSRAFVCAPPPRRRRRSSRRSREEPARRGRRR
mmetsp:Transcript_8890/g.16407  ORF Transcript_8890/g.16407 Transcript_8890/m.16407 type:complete len:129 (-) Transcript_8890:1310-1696(-)